MSAKSLSIIWLGVKDLGITGLGLGIAMKTLFSKGVCYIGVFFPGWIFILMLLLLTCLLLLNSFVARP